MLFAAYCLLGWNVKLPLVCFICFLLSSPSPSLSLSFSDLSLVAGLFLLSPAMMAPHLAVGTMRNDKMGEPCFYLMGQNQTTVCSQKSAMIHPPPSPPDPPTPCPLVIFLFWFSPHPFVRSTRTCILLCLYVTKWTSFLSCRAWNPTFHITLYTHVERTRTNIMPPVIKCCCHSNLANFSKSPFIWFFFDFVDPNDTPHHILLNAFSGACVVIDNPAPHLPMFTCSCLWNHLVIHLQPWRQNVLKPRFTSVQPPSLFVRKIVVHQCEP